MASSKTILIADDSATFRSYVRDVLQASQHRVECLDACNGLEALDVLGSRPVDIVVLDLMMPELSGEETLARLHKTGRRQFLVATSSAITNETRETLSAFGAYEFLPKPVEPEKLVGILGFFDVIKRRRRALVVDDSATVRSVVRRVLGHSLFEFDIDEAADGASAIELALASRYDIIFLDVNMPGIGGLETARTLLGRTWNTVIVMMSRSADADLVARVRETGVGAFLKKPFYGRDVDSILHSLLGLKHPTLVKETALFAETRP
ncbi:response regulator [Methylobrevis pamukkalensis]|uniref:Response regulator UvrY n=1 Tax=Methylobrevis pamukkalensis TaxID=1439726 RepID=A0A1E3GZJ6_9HYPH|nr:response regulator [Methylobrevis pamukkalensis]ODN69483.1 Response regulator UvrY [Methylobrevis pamukkalensis]